MGMSVKSAGGGGGRRRRRRGGGRAPMAEINVTPFVDVMLVLLIIFMVAAPLLTVGVPVELPQSQGKQLESSAKEPLTVSVAANGEVFIGETKVPLEDIATKLKAIAKDNVDEQIFVRGDQGITYGVVMKVMGRISAGGFKKVSLVTEVEEGG